MRARDAGGNRSGRGAKHVTVGIGTVEYLDKMLAEPFATFTFSPAAASVYQLGNYGTARKKLKMFKLKR